MDVGGVGWMVVWGGTGNERPVWPASTAGKPSATELRARAYTTMPVCVYGKFSIPSGSPHVHLPPVLQQLPLQHLLRRSHRPRCDTCQVRTVCTAAFSLLTYYRESAHSPPPVLQATPATLVLQHLLRATDLGVLYTPMVCPTRSRSRWPALATVRKRRPKPVR